MGGVTLATSSAPRRWPQAAAGVHDRHFSPSTTAPSEGAALQGKRLWVPGPTG